MATLAVASLTSPRALAHCDGLDGPVVNAARQALAENKLDLALAWVQKGDEAEIKRAFDKTVAVRKLGSEAKELAELYFFETLVRLHRAGEGAPYTGLKPAGRDLGPAIPAGDKALETADLGPVLHLLTTDLKRGLQKHFTEALAKKKSSKGGLEASREFVAAYVVYIHYVEGLYQAAKGATEGHPGDNHESHAAHAAAHKEK